MICLLASFSSQSISFIIKECLFILNNIIEGMILDEDKMYCINNKILSFMLEDLLEHVIKYLSNYLYN